ncbi:MAG: lactate utilization protein [Treponema sp.]|jgi:L-lactate utilization protein LutB|nr:lactate utilization protein [Treponema sp.]
MASPKEIRNAKLGVRVAKALEARHFEAWYVDSAAEAVGKALSLIPQTHTVSWGGSMTVDDLGIKQRLEERGNKIIDRDKATSKEERMELMRQALLCDTFLASSNAISEDGQLVNVDGFGNRVAAMIFGPCQVIVLAGMNKVVKTLDDATQRARTIASPLNMQRFTGLKTSCAETGGCANCMSLDSICSFIVTTRLCKPAGRIKVILIGEDLGL